MPDVIIVGRNPLLGAQLAAMLLASPGQRLTWLLDEVDNWVARDLTNLVAECLSRISGDRAPGLEESWWERMKLVFWKTDQEDSVKASEAWFLTGKCSLPGVANNEFEEDCLRRSLHLIATSGVGVLNYVGSIYDGDRGTPAHSNTPQLSAAEREVCRFCAEHKIRVRLFLSSWLVGEHCLPHDSGQGVDRLFHIMDELTAEIQERSSEYFDFHALRVLASTDATVNLVRMDHAVQLMVYTSAHKKVFDFPYCIVSTEETPFSDFCELLGEVYGLRIFCVENPEALNAIDRLFGFQLAGTEAAWSGQKACIYQNTGAGVGLELSQDAQAAFLFSIHQSLGKARLARDERIADFHGKMEKRTAPRDVSTLTYYIAGTQGEYILVLNALGQPLDYWSRLIDILMRRYRVIIWETRGLSLEAGELRLSDLVDDIEVIVRQEQIDSCHLVGWCNGPQVAMEFYVRHPEPILDMVFLNCAFTIPGRSDLQTSYGETLEALCRIMIDNPSMTGSIHRSLSVPPVTEANLDDSDAEGRAIQVLSLTNIHLRESVRAPFRTEISTFNYARQILHLVASPTLDYAAIVQA